MVTISPRVISAIDRLREIAANVDRRSFRRLIMAFATFTVVFALLAVDFSPKRISGLEVGRPSPVMVMAPRTITLLDMERTQELRRRAADRVSRILRFDVGAPARVRSEINGFYQQLWASLSNEDLDGGQRRQDVLKMLPTELAPEDVDWVLTLGRDELDGLESKTLELAASFMAERIGTKELEVKKDEVRRRATAIEEPGIGRLAGAVAATNLRTNSFIDKQRTNRAIAAAVDKIKPVEATKLKSEIIVGEGEIVTPLQERFLRELGLAASLKGTTAGQIVGQAMIALAIVVLALIYLRAFQPMVYEDNRLLFLVFVILMTISLVAKGLAPLFPPFLIPVAGAAMLTTILVRPRAGIMMAITSGLITGIIVNSPQYWIYALMTGLFAVYLTARISHRSDLTRAGLWLMLASGVIALAAGLIKGDMGLELMINSGWGVIGGFAAIIITIGTLQFLESAFNITTDMKLLELSNPTQPLLRELMVNAPGTYNHSIIAGNLVESAAQEVGANPLLARTGAYYHDIGKIRRPFFFVENQYGDNPHDKTQPNLSYLIITAHVKEGIEIAKKHRLPQEIVDVIAQHHGTSLMTYFYSRAKERDKDARIAEHHFRYTGEKPCSREAALVMLADAVEAAARALKKPTHNRLEQLVKRIVKERLRDGQLDGCALTLADLKTITQSYTQTLSTMYHSRIEYPETVDPESRTGEVTVGRLDRKSIGRIS